MKRPSCVAALVAIVFIINGNAQTASNSNWVLSWSDEFNAKDGIDSKKWTAETGGDGWGNNELEYYTASRRNARQEHGSLILEAIREPYIGPDGVKRDYTSARLKTQHKFSQAYGRFEARIQVPQGKGMWPAFWLLGDDIDVVHWPNCGEIDIVENIGIEPGVIHGTIHGPGYSGAHGACSPWVPSPC